MCKFKMLNTFDDSSNALKLKANFDIFVLICVIESHKRKNSGKGKFKAKVSQIDIHNTCYFKCS